MHTVQKMGREPEQFITMHGFMYGLGNQIIAHAHHLTVLETELPCRLSQCLMPLKMTGRSSSEATAHCKK